MAQSGEVASSEAPQAQQRPPTSRRAQAAWCLYDWANQGYPTIIETFIFATFFTQVVAVNEVEGTAQWGYALSVAGLFIILLSPIFGAVADQGGRRKPWLAGFSGLCMAACAMLWFTQPSNDYVLWALVFFALGSATYEFSLIFYNAMLPDVAPPGRLGRLSGWGWSAGYAGGLASLVLILLLFVQPEQPLFGLDRETSEHVRVSALVVAGWWFLFGLPLFFFVPDRKSTGVPLSQAVRRGLRQLLQTARNLPRYRNVARFLLARMLYNDGLNTVFAFGAIYAAGTFGMGFDQIVLFGIGLNITAGLGAFAFAWIIDMIGSKRTIQISLVGMMLIGIVLVLLQSVFWFWVFGLMLGIFFGPVQAASRAMMAQLAPQGLEGEMFGLYALSGKAIAFLGPAVLAFTTGFFESQRAGMASIMLFLILGFALLWGVREPSRRGESA
ncbi:MFS transporter [Aquibaculum sediminis]|uniref:MFS transporter n=1 Tax=Aquibaculum sediminis TaxID=3231907 RepID=UPI003451D7FC